MMRLRRLEIPIFPAPRRRRRGEDLGPPNDRRSKLGTGTLWCIATRASSMCGTHGAARIRLSRNGCDVTNLLKRFAEPSPVQSDYSSMVLVLLSLETTSRCRECIDPCVFEAFELRCASTPCRQPAAHRPRLPTTANGCELPEARCVHSQPRFGTTSPAQFSNQPSGR
jgi:hypothetical protein